MKPTKSNQRVLLEILAGFMLVVGILLIVEQFYFKTEVVVQPSPQANEFIELCSGLESLDQTTYLIGVANCLGRIRGFADGHQMTVKMQPRSSFAVPAMWCIDSSVTDKDVLNAVIQWTVDNPEETKTITVQTDSVNAATAITIHALHDSFPCKDNNE